MKAQNVNLFAGPVDLMWTQQRRVLGMKMFMLEVLVSLELVRKNGST
jgi:hypothetical protein